MCGINPEQYPETVSSILTQLREIPYKVLESIDQPELLPPGVIALIVAEKTIYETLKVVDSHTEMVYTESVAVPVMEHQGPDIQYTHVPQTDAIKDLPNIYWDMVSEK